MRLQNIDNSSFISVNKSDNIIEAAGGQEGESGMRLQNIDNSSFISVNKSDNSLRLLVPDKDVATITATDHKLASGSVEIDPLDRGRVPVTLVLVTVTRTFCIICVKQINILIIVASNQFSSILTEHCTSDISLELVGGPQ